MLLTSECLFLQLFLRHCPNFHYMGRYNLLSSLYLLIDSSRHSSGKGSAVRYMDFYQTCGVSYAKSCTSVFYALYHIVSHLYSLKLNDVMGDICLFLISASLNAPHEPANPRDDLLVLISVGLLDSAFRKHASFYLKLGPFQCDSSQFCELH